jgi:hypothetical protein
MRLYPYKRCDCPGFLEDENEREEEYYDYEHGYG